MAWFQSHASLELTSHVDQRFLKIIIVRMIATNAGRLPWVFTRLCQ